MNVTRAQDEEGESFGGDSPPRKKLSKCPASSISYSHSPHFISSILRHSVALVNDTNVPDTALDAPLVEEAPVEEVELDTKIVQSPEYPVLHLVEDPGTGAIREAEEEPLDADLQRLASEAASKGREVQDENREKGPEGWVPNKIGKGRNKAKKENWVLRKKTRKDKSNSGHHALPQRRSERVFVKDSVINYADDAVEEEKEESDPNYESPPNKNPEKPKRLVRSPTMSSIPLENLSSSMIAKIGQKESEKVSDCGIESDSAAQCPTCDKTFNRQNFYFHRHKAICGTSSSSAKTDEKRECPVCRKSYTMLGRGQSYFKDHVRACQATHSQNRKRSMDELEAEEVNDKDDFEMEMKNNKSGGERVQSSDSFEERKKSRTSKIRLSENSANQGGEKARSAKNERSALKEGGKKSKKFLSSLGLFDPEGAMAGIVRMSTEPLLDACLHDQNEVEKPVTNQEAIENMDMWHVPTKNGDTYNKTNTGKQSVEKIVPSSLVHHSPLLPQICDLARNLPSLKLEDKEDLSLHFPSLLAVPQLEDVVRVFLMFHQRSPDDLSKTERQFADLLVTELHCAEIQEMKQLEQLVVGVNQKKPEATIDVWIRELTVANQRLESMALADQMETYFDLDIAIQVHRGSTHPTS